MSSLAGLWSGCGGSSSTTQRLPADTIPAVTVSVPPRGADGLIDSLLAFAARNRWALSVRTDSAAADLVFRDSAGRLVSCVRSGTSVVARARELARMAGVPSADSHRHGDP